MQRKPSARNSYCQIQRDTGNSIYYYGEQSSINSCDKIQTAPYSNKHIHSFSTYSYTNTVVVNGPAHQIRASSQLAAQRIYHRVYGCVSNCCEQAGFEFPLGNRVYKIYSSFTATEHCLQKTF